MCCQHIFFHCKLRSSPISLSLSLSPSMASSSSLLAGILISLSLATTDARICKTLVYYYSISSSGSEFSQLATSSSSSLFHGEVPSRFLEVYRISTVTPDRLNRFSGVDLDEEISIGGRIGGLLDQSRRARDVIAVVAALLFGLGCGLLATATMYLVWALTAARFDFYGDDFEEDGDEEDIVGNPNRSGYTMVPGGPETSPAK